MDAPPTALSNQPTPSAGQAAGVFEHKENDMSKTLQAFIALAVVYALSALVGLTAAVLEASL